MCVSCIATYDFIVGNDNVTWDDATAWCLNNHGRYLASIQTDSENAAAVEVCLSSNASYPCWIGARCYDSDCTDWEWHDGSIWSYTNWYAASDEPNGANRNEDCVEMYGNGYWNDNKCALGRLALCGNKGIMTLGYIHIYMLFIKNDHCSEMITNSLMSTQSQHLHHLDHRLPRQVIPKQLPPKVPPLTQQPIRL